MIAVEGQYFFRFDLGGERDFIPEDRFTSFHMFEEVGNVLPTYKLTFATDDESIIGSLHEGNFFNVTFGADESESNPTVASFTIAKAAIGRSGNNMRGVTLLGTLAALPYINETKFRLMGPMSGLEAIAELASDHFSWVDAQPKISDDSQVWIQHGATTRKTVSDIWLHSKIKDSCPLLAIGLNGSFKIRSLSTLGRAGEKWSFTVKGSGGTSVAILGNQGINTNTTFLNSWAGYGRYMRQTPFDKDFPKLDRATTLEDGTGVQPDMVSSSVKSLVGRVNPLMRAKVVKPRWDETVFASENVHKDYWQTYNDNLALMATHSSVLVRVLIKGVGPAIELLDPVMFSDLSCVSDSSVESTSGKYIVTKISRGVTVRDYRMIVEMAREGLANADGALR